MWVLFLTDMISAKVMNSHASMLASSGKDLKEEEVIQQIKATLGGDASAFTPLVEKYWRLVWYIVTRFSFDGDTAEDLVQKSFIRAYENLSRWSPTGTFSSWLATVTRNECLTHLKKTKNHRKNLKLYQDHVSMRQEDMSDATDRLSALDHCLNQLEGKAQEVLKLHYHERMPFQKIAILLNCSLDATRKLASRVRGVLRECINNRMARL